MEWFKRTEEQQNYFKHLEFVGLLAMTEYAKLLTAIITATLAVLIGVLSYCLSAVNNVPKYLTFLTLIYLVVMVVNLIINLLSYKYSYENSIKALEYYNNHYNEYNPNISFFNSSNSLQNHSFIIWCIDLICIMVTFSWYVLNKLISN